MADSPPVVPGSYGEARRRARPGGDVTHAEAVPEPLEEPGQGAQGAPGAGLRPAREAGGVVAGSELARAFQANADALQNLGAMQAQMLQAIGRNDRSEMMLASTQTLNETFRHLTLIQRELLGRLESTAKESKRSGRAVPVLLLGLMAVVVMATYVLVDVFQQAIEKHDPRAITEHAVATMQREREDAGKSSDAEAQRVREDLRAEEEKRRALETQLANERDERDAAQRDATLKDTELAGLRHQFTTAQNEALKVPSLESEIRDLASKLAVGEPRMRSMQEELEEQRRENSRLRKKIAGERLGFPEDDPGTAPEPAAAKPAASPSPAEAFPPPAPEREPARAPPATGPAASPAATPTVPPGPAAAPPAPLTRDTEGTRDPRTLDNVRSRLNQLFDAAGSKRPEYWQVMRVDAVTQDRLKGVIMNRYDADARLVESVEAREAFVWVERNNRRVMLELRQGERVAGGRRTPLADKFQTVLAEGEALTQVFGASGLRLIGSR